MPEASSSFITFLTSYKNKPEICCRKDILSLVNWWQLTVPSLTLFFPWPGPITEVEARRQHGLMIQILAGLITYLLPAIYCHEQHGEQVSINKVRQLRNQILNESRMTESQILEQKQQVNKSTKKLYASP